MGEVTVIVIGPPHANTIVPPAVAAACSAAAVQLAGVPSPTVVVGVDVSTSEGRAHVAAGGAASIDVPPSSPPPPSWPPPHAATQTNTKAHFPTIESISQYNSTMAKTEPSPLTEAAEAFDAALAAYTRLGELFLKAPLDTLKHLERANTTLGELADGEQRLQETGQRLIAAVAAARDRQQKLSADIVARAPALQARNGKLGELMSALHEIAGEVGKLNDEIAQRQPGSVVPSGSGDVSSAVLALSERAEVLAQDARAAEFPELADQAHALYQRLQAIGKKLKMTGAGN